MKTHLRIAAIALNAALAGCGTLGSTEDAPVFPDPARDAWVKEGTFPNLDNLRQAGPGLDKTQLYALLGSPRFSEGLFGVREWDYLFNFRIGDAVVRCQYKIVFDQDARARKVFWAPRECADRAAPRVAVASAPVMAATTPPPVAAPAQNTAGVAPRRMQIASDALFTFDRAGLQDLRPDGARELARIADELRAQGGFARLEVSAYTDRLGTPAHNLRLSEQRAETVRGVLAAHGLPKERISAIGRGADTPSAACSDAAPQPALIACLAPNRRFEILAWPAEGAAR